MAGASTLPASLGVDVRIMQQRVYGRNPALPITINRQILDVDVDADYDPERHVPTAERKRALERRQVLERVCATRCDEDLTDCRRWRALGWVLILNNTCARRVEAVPGQLPAVAPVDPVPVDVVVVAPTGPGSDGGGPRA